MKKTLFIILASLSLAACEKSGGGKTEQAPDPIKYDLNAALPSNGSILTTSIVNQESTEYVVDRDTSTQLFWKPEETGDFFQIEFEVETDIQEIALYSSRVFMGKDYIYEVELSKDGFDWIQTIDGTRSNSEHVGCQTILLSSERLYCELSTFNQDNNYRFIRLTTTAIEAAEIDSIEIYELEVNGTQLK